MNTLIRNWQRRRKKVPVIRQISQNECGPACMAMLFGYHGHRIPLHIMTEDCQAFRNGASALAMKKAAEKYGYLLRAYRMEQPEHLQSLELPVILHWDYDHYVILEAWQDQKVRIVDPEHGRKWISSETFRDHFSGIVLTLELKDPSKIPQFQQTEGWRLILRYALMLPKMTLLMLVFSVLVQLIGVAVPLLVGFLIDRFLDDWNASTYSSLIISTVTIFAVYFLLSYIRSVVFAQLQRHISSTLSRDFLSHLLKLPLTFFEQRNTGDLATRMSNISMIREILSTSGVAIVLDLTMLFIAAGAMLYQSLFLSLITFLIAIVQLGIMLIFIPMIRKSSQQELSAQATSQSYLIEALRGSILVKAMNREETVLRNWLATFSEQMKHFVIRFLRSGMLNSIVSSLGTIVPLLLLMIGFLEIQKGNLTIGTLVAFSSLAVSFLSPINSLISYVQSFQLLMSVIERLQDVLHAKPDDTTQSEKQKRMSVDLSNAPIRLQDVDFSYDRGSEILRNLTMEITPGSKIALVGPTGSGKSTIVKLILGLYLPTSGRITYGDLSTDQIDFRHLRQQIGVVLQDTHLFHGSIAKNISFFDEVPMEKVLLASKMACLHEDVMRMPLGYHTQIGENGQNLSGGQRQRLSIARALLHQPRLLVLDEATSHLDSLTEQKLNQTFRDHKITQIVIAHRLSTITDADEIIVLHNGIVEAAGTHEDLLQSSDLYRNLWEKQYQHTVTT